MIVGHSTGLDAAYYKLQDEEILTEYLKAANSLTVNNEFRLKKQIQFYKQKTDGMDEMRKQLREIQEKFRMIKERGS